MAELKTKIILRNDIAANWSTHNPVLLLGEVGIETDTNKVKIGDGTTAWNSLSYFGGEAAQVFQCTCAKGADKVSALNTQVTASVTVHVGDIGIVKEDIETVTTAGSATHKQYTAYVCTTEGIGGASATCVWAAMDGNYNAENVYFADDLTYTSAIGAIPAPSGGSGTLYASGKNIKEVLSSILAKEAKGSITQPSLTLKLTNSGSYEVGTKITSSTYSTTFSAGSYTYGPTPTGVAVNSYTISDNKSHSGTTASGDLLSASTASPFIIESEGTVYTLSAKVNHTVGEWAKTNLGNQPSIGELAQRIAANTALAATSQTYEGYYNTYYWGTLGDVQTATYFDTAAAAYNVVRSQNKTAAETITMASGKKTLYFITKGKKVSKLFNNTTFDDWTSQLSNVSTVTIGCADSTASSKGDYAQTYNIQVLNLADGAAKDYSLTVTYVNA